MNLRLGSTALAAVALLLACPPALAAGDGERTPLDLTEETGRASSGGGGSLVRTFVGLAVVIGVIYGLHWVLKQVKASRDERASGDGLEAIAALPLGAGRSLHVVRAGREIVVLGASEHAVVPIRTYSEDEARAAGLIGDDEPEAAAGEPAKPAAARALEALAGLRAAQGERTAAARATRAARPRPAAGSGLLSTVRAWTVRG